MSDDDKDWEALKMYFSGEPLDIDQERRVAAVLGPETSELQLTMVLGLLLMVTTYAILHL